MSGTQGLLLNSSRIFDRANSLRVVNIHFDLNMYVTRILFVLVKELKATVGDTMLYTLIDWTLISVISFDNSFWPN